ncbi:MAG: NmrA family NAD(P)-binding protein [Bacteroidota bacterium]|nr:NmrA family NAD(P)-binding protein [Bacteroidota bacterium]
MKKAILVVGSTGNLGNRICRQLVERGAAVSAIIRTTSDAAKIENLKKIGVKVIEVDVNNIDDIAKACTGADCVVSALAGLREVIVDLQKRILDGAMQAGVPRFIPSDFCTDYSDLVPGENRNFDLRREFKSYIDTTSIGVSSIFNGAFAEILTYNIPLLNRKDKCIAFWGEKSDWKLDFTTIDETAAFTAQVALDDTAPRDLQIASFQISPNMIWAAVKEATGEEYRIYQLSTLEDFAKLIKKQRGDNPAGENELYAKWQQSQYMHSMFSTHHNHLANDRYKDLVWTTGLAYIKSVVK